VQPYTDFSFVYTNKNPAGILQFDRLNPSTQLPPIDFPQFTTLDSISDWTILRLGTRQQFQTRRDDNTVEWLTTDSYFDFNLEKPRYPGFPSEHAFSNFHNNISWTPVPWATLNIESQLPLINSGYEEVNPIVSVRVNEDLTFDIGHKFLSGNPYFANSSQLSFGSYFHINDNWAFSFDERYEFDDSTLEAQDYTIHRELSSWVVAFGVSLRNNLNTTTNKSVNDLGIILTFTLKDLPSLRIPVTPSTTLLQ